ncbi:MAG: cyclic nucleotide-binding domain-containing protein [Desulfobulbaceae bacterium]|nr:cyclic nucleotide-binding domain-containing protein [Desulfobulbaceae bacterium]
MKISAAQKMKHPIPNSELKQELKSILNSFSNSEIEELSSFLECRDWPADATIMNEGEPYNFMGFILKGRLALKKETSFHGRHFLLAILEKGSTVGEFSISGRTHISATVTALEDSLLLTLTSDRMDDLVETNPALGVKLLRHILSIANKKYKNALDRLSMIL